MHERAQDLRDRCRGRSGRIARCVFLLDRLLWPLLRLGRSRPAGGPGGDREHAPAAGLPPAPHAPPGAHLRRRHAGGPQRHHRRGRVARLHQSHLPAHAACGRRGERSGAGPDLTRRAEFGDRPAGGRDRPASSRRRSSAEAPGEHRPAADPAAAASGQDVCGPPWLLELRRGGPGRSGGPTPPL
jgi:hypothetical protein